jgi:hypothetical protein
VVSEGEAGELAYLGCHSRLLIYSLPSASFRTFEHLSSLTKSIKYMTMTCSKCLARPWGSLHISEIPAHWRRADHLPWQHVAKKFLQHFEC